MRKQSRVRQHKTPAEKAEIVASYERDGLSLRDCAARHGISFSALQRWVRQGQMSKEAAGPAQLIEVPNVFAAPPATAIYRVCFPRGLVLGLRAGWEAGELRSLAQVLQNL